MGDPRRIKKKFFTPVHPWQAENIEAERALSNEYALVNKHELWKMKSLLKNFKDQAKKLIAARGTQAEREKSQLMQRLQRYGLLQSTSKLDDILGLTIKDILERRLQSMVYRKGFARSMKQARQFITHRHVRVGERKVSSPSHFTTVSEESFISFSPRSSLTNPEHPERTPIEKKGKAKSTTEIPTEKTEPVPTATPTEAAPSTQEAS